MFTFPVGHWSGDTEENLLQIIQRLGLDTGLQACFDIAEGDCYDGSAQDVFDLTANDLDFWRGAGSGSSTDDPTFVGTADDLLKDTYFQGDGGDFLTAKAQPSFIQAYHKAGAALTVIAGVYLPLVAINTLFGTRGPQASTIGCMWQVNSGSGVLSFYVSNSADVLTINSSAGITANTNSFIAVALNEPTGTAGATLMINATQESFTSTYSGASGSNATNTLRMMDRSDGLAPFENNGRLHFMAFWNTRLSDANLTSIRNELYTGSGRFA